MFDCFNIVDAWKCYFGDKKEEKKQTFAIH